MFRDLANAETGKESCVIKYHTQVPTVSNEAHRSIWLNTSSSPAGNFKSNQCLPRVRGT